MKLKSIFYGLSALLLTSCVGEDIVFSGSNFGENFAFNRQLLSVAYDETPQIRVRNNGEIVDLQESDSDFDIIFSSSNPDYLEIDSNGVITTNSDAIGESVIINVSFALKESAQKTDEPIQVPEPISDSVVIGLVTIAEIDAKGIPNVDEVVRNGYTPVITINENFKEVDVNTTEELKLIAILQGLKKEVVEDAVFEWRSSNTNILTINSEGVLTPIKKGNTQITVTTKFNGQGYSLTKKIRVGAKTVEETPTNPEPGNDKEIIAFGGLVSNSSYGVQGDFEIFSENGKTFISVSDNFDTRIGDRGVPDLTIYLSNSTESNGGDAQLIASAESKPEGLKSFGGQVLEIPDTIDIDKFQNVLLYCRRFGVKVGFGIIKR